MAAGLMTGLGTLAAKAAIDRVQSLKKTTGASVPNNTQTQAATVPAVQSTPQVYSGNTTSIPQNGIGIRAALNDVGYDNNRIGWDGANVTVDGQKFISPDSVVGGTSYSSKDNVYKAINDRLASEGDSAQAATDYWASQGVSNGVQYVGNGLVSMGGKTMKPLYITDDGKAIFRTSDLEKVFSDWKSQSGYRTGADVFNQTQDKYGSMIDSALDDVLDRREWDYDIENDEAYRAYRDMYTREGNRAMEDAIAAYSGNTGGYVNSAALTAGGQAQNYYMQQLGDRIPELQANDYSRYLGEQELRRQALNAVMGVSDDYYGKLLETSQEDRNAINNAFDSSYNRNLAERQWQDAHAQNLQTQALNDYAIQAEAAAAPYYADNARLENESMNLSNRAAEQSILINQINMQQSQIENAFANGRSRGFFTTDEAAVLGVPEGTSPYDAELTYTGLMNQLEVSKQKALGEIEVQTRLAAAAAEPRLTAAQVKAAYDGGVSTPEVEEQYRYYYGATPKELEEQAAASAAEYGKGYNEVAEAAKHYGYAELKNMPPNLIASVILQSDISDETKSSLLEDFGISGEYAKIIYHALNDA